MYFSTTISAASYLSFSLLAAKGSFAQGRLLAPATPQSCDATDFELPPELMGAHQGMGLPPFITPEIFGTFVSLKEGWTPGLASTETPMVARIAHLADTMHWNCAAMYSSTWLDALTKEDPLLRSPVSHEGITFHASSPRFLCMVHAWAAVVKEWQPKAFPSLSTVLELFGFDELSYEFNPQVDAAFDEETGEPNIEDLNAIAAANCFKPEIMGAIAARQLTEYGRRDGYNMYGDLGRDGKPCTANCRRFTDPTGYTPFSPKSSKSSKNSKQSKPEERWKPMLEDDGRGYFTRQEHVAPHIGKLAKRAVLSDEDFNLRTLEKPEYDYNQEARQVATRLAATAIDDMKKAKIEFFDDKIKVIFAVLNSVVSYGTSFEQLLNFVFGITSSEYDSILVSWKEKVKHDLVRPTTWIQEQMTDEDFTTYGGPNLGVKTIRGHDFESWVRVMPHSEYISGSACICQSIKDFTEGWMTLTDGHLSGPNMFNGVSIPVRIATDDPLGRDAPFLKGSSKTEPDSTPSQNLYLTAADMTEYRDFCGESRLDGGMHFSKSVPDAYDLCDGLGNIAAEYSIELLGEGGWADTVWVA